MQTQETNVRICPKCGKTYRGHPAISRVDNETPICCEPLNLDFKTILQH